MKYNYTSEIAYNPAQFQDYNAVQRMRMQLDMSNHVIQMRINEFFFRCKLRLHSNGAKQFVGYLITQGKQYTKRSVARIGHESAGITRRHEHRIMDVFLEEQEKLEKELGFKLIKKISGKKTWNVNTYIIDQIIYEFPRLVEELINMLPDKLLLSVKTPCHTIVKYIIKEIISLARKLRKTQKANASRDSFFPKRKKVDGSELSSTAKPQV